MSQDPASTPENLTITNSTLYSLLQTVHANQTQIIIPDLNALARSVAALFTSIAELQSDLDSKIAILDAKLDQISAQVTPPETGDLNLSTATITNLKE